VSLGEFSVNQPETKGGGSPDAHYGECDALQHGKNAASCHVPAYYRPDLALGCDSVFIALLHRRQKIIESHSVE